MGAESFHSGRTNGLVSGIAANNKGATARARSGAKIHFMSRIFATKRAAGRLSNGGRLRPKKIEITDLVTVPDNVALSRNDAVEADLQRKTV